MLNEEASKVYIEFFFDRCCRTNNYCSVRSFNWCSKQGAEYIAVRGSNSEFSHRYFILKRWAVVIRAVIYNLVQPAKMLM